MQEGRSAKQDKQENRERKTEANELRPALCVFTILFSAAATGSVCVCVEFLSRSFSGKNKISIK